MTKNNFAAKLINYYELCIMNYELFCNFARKYRNMKIIEKVKKYSLLVWRSQALKYAVVFVVGVLIVGFLDENSLWSHMKNRQRIDELQEEKARYNASYQRDQAQIRELNTNPKAMERIARERYFMKADDEDIYVLRENNTDSEETGADETAE